jgi:soluble lytic murein transglycosylase-like protein
MDVGVTPPCVIQAAADYSIPPRALLALKLALVPRRELERGVTGQPAAPAAFPVNVSWQQALAKSFGITAEAIKTDLCWSARAAAYVLRHEVNLANGDFWEGVGRFPSSTPSGQLATAPPLAALVHTASLRYGLDPRFVSAIIRVESGFTASARSPKGALGLMQVMPGTAARYGLTNFFLRLSTLKSEHGTCATSGRCSMAIWHSPSPPTTPAKARWPSTACAYLHTKKPSDTSTT